MASTGTKIDALTLSPAQQEEQLNTILDFLALVHPSLTNNNSGACVELRPLARNQDNVPFVLFKNSYNTWQLREKDIDILRRWLDARNGYPMCMYYSVYSYDYDKRTLTKSGKVAQKGKITVEAAKFAEELPLDFDHCDEEEMKKYDEMFESIGIHPLWLFSGHGYQAHILLTDKVVGKTLKYLVKLIRAKGFTHVDPACVDEARMMRLPYTFNAKCFEKRTKYPEERENPPMCHVVKFSDKRVSLKNLIDALESIPTKDMDEYIAALSIRDEVKSLPQNEQSAADTKPQPIDAGNRVMPEYPAGLFEAVKAKDFPTAIKKMLTFTPQGYRHDTMAFLINFLTVYLGITATKTRDILKIWNEKACEPSLENYDAEFSNLWPGSGKYSLRKLAAQHGFIDLKKYLEIRLSNEIKLPYALFDEMGTIKNNAVCVYLAVAIAEHDGVVSDIKIIAELANLKSICTARNCIKELIAKGFIYTVKGWKAKGIPDTYKVSAFTNNAGFLPLEYLVAKDYINLPAGEVCLLLTLRRVCAHKTDVIVNQGNLGKAVGCTRNNVSLLMKNLEMRGYIAIARNYMDKVKYQCMVDVLK
jgi:hypothetical protein